MWVRRVSAQARAKDGSFYFYVGGEDGDVGAEELASGNEEGFVGDRGVEGFSGGADHADGAEGEEDRDGALWRSRSDYVDSTQPKERGGGEEVAVVRVDLTIAVLCRAGEVQSVGGAEKNGGRSGLVKLLHPLLDGIAQGQPNEQAVV